MKPTEFVIMQHGEAECDVLGVVGGERGDTGLTREGRVQVSLRAAAMCEQDGERPYDFVFTGARPRQRQTARIVGAVLDARVVGDQALICQRYAHDLDARPWSEVHGLLGGAPSSRPELPVGRGAESWNAYVARLVKAFARMSSRYPAARIVVVGDTGHVDASLRLFASDPGDSGLGGGSGHQPAGLTCWREQPPAGHSQASGVRWSLIEHGAPLAAAGAPAAGLGPGGRTGSDTYPDASTPGGGRDE